MYFVPLHLVREGAAGSPSSPYVLNERINSTSLPAS